MDSFKFMASMAVENGLENAKALAAGGLESMVHQLRHNLLALQPQLALHPDLGEEF